MYRYWGYGLHIESELEFPELLPREFVDEPDLKISYGETPSAITGDNVVHKSNCSISPDQYLLWLPVARYYVSSGKSILVSPSKGSDEKSVRLFLLSNAMAAILHQRNEIMLHASAVCVKGGVVLFCGHSGAGKSTIAASLQARGYQIFSDDVCILKRENAIDEVKVSPTYPMMKLWEDSFEKLGLKKPDSDMEIRPGVNKYSKFIHTNYQTDSMPVLKIFLLNPAENGSEEVSIQSLTPTTSFMKIQSQTYRTGQINAMGMHGQHFLTISALIAKVPVYEISRKSSDNTVAQLAEKVIHYLSYVEQ